MSSKLLLFGGLLILFFDGCLREKHILEFDIQDSTDVEPPSPKIVFVSQRDGNPEIYSMDLEGNDQTRLTFHDDVDHNPTISPDGKKIAFLSINDGQEAIWIMDTDGCGGSKILDIPGEQHSFQPLYFSSDGEIIIHYSYDNHALSLVNSDGSNPISIYRVWIASGYLIFSPADGLLLFPCDIQGSGWYDIILMDITTRNMVNLTPDTFPQYDDCASFSPDLENIVYIVSDPSWANDYIYKLNYGNSTLQCLTNDSISNPYWPRYSPDGSKIIFCAQRNYHSKQMMRMDHVIYVMDPDGSNLHQLSNQNAYSNQVVFSKSNADIFYPTGSGIYKANLLNLNEELLCNIVFPYYLKLSESHIFFEAENVIWRVGLDGTDLRNLTDYNDMNYCFSIFLR